MVLVTYSLTVNFVRFIWVDYWLWVLQTVTAIEARQMSLDRRRVPKSTNFQSIWYWNFVETIVNYVLVANSNLVHVFESPFQVIEVVANSPSGKFRWTDFW